MTGRFDQPHDHSMSFGEHLEELRRRIILGLIVPLPLMILIFALNMAFDNILVEWLKQPVIDALRANGLPTTLQLLGLTEMVVLQMKLCLIMALVLSAPWILYQAWKFIEPGLFSHEKRFVHFLLPFSGVLVIVGIALLYYAMLPLMLRVLISFGMMGATQPAADARLTEILANNPVPHMTTSVPTTGEAGSLYLVWPNMDLHAVVAGASGGVEVLAVPRATTRQEFRLSEYVNLVLMLMLAIAIAFQMPLVIALLGWMGLASPQWLRKQRRYALMICGVISVVITPPDALSALIMLVPLYGLYELGILMLVIAPASAVAEGRVFSLSRITRKPADNRREPMDGPTQPAQTDRPVPRRTSVEQPAPHSADRGEDKP